MPGKKWTSQPTLYERFVWSPDGQRRIPDPELESDACTCLGLLCEMKGEIDPAEEWILAAYEIDKKRPDRVRLASVRPVRPGRQRRGTAFAVGWRERWL